MTLHASLKRLFWNRIRPAYLAVVGWLSQLLRRIAPPFANGLEIVAYDVAEQLRHSKSARASTASLNVRGVRFNLSIVANHPHAYEQYMKIAANGDAYEPVMVECLTRILREVNEPAFIDIGAFMGFYACYVSALLKDLEPTYAIESNPRYVEAIRRSATLNGFSRLMIYEAALSDRLENVGIEGETILFGGQGANGARTTTLDDLCQRERIRPKVVKIDVHGAEGKVLGGMRQVLRDSIEFVLLEVHPADYLKRYSGMCRADILTILEQSGLYLFYVAGHRYRRSDGLQQFLESGTFAYRRLDESTKDLLLFDRHVDIFVLGSKVADLEPILGASRMDPALAR